MGLKSFAPIHTVHRHNNYQNWRILTFQLNCVSNKETAYGQISEMAYDASRSAVLPVRSRLVYTYFTPTNQTVLSFRLFIYDNDSAEDPRKPSCVVINTIWAISGSYMIRLHSAEFADYTHQAHSLLKSQQGLIYSKNSPHFREHRSFITVFETYRRELLPWLTWYNSTPLQPLS